MIDIVSIASHLVLTPILGLILLGLRRERMEKERLLKETLQALNVIGISRGRRR